MARMTLAAVAGFCLIALGPQVCLAQGATAPSPPPPAGALPAPLPGEVMGGRGAGRAAMSACRGDMISLCGGVARGGGRKFACLKENQAKLSTPCLAAIQSVVDKGGNRGPGIVGGKGMAACRADIASVCTGVEKGKGGVGMCLRENAAKLSQPCQSMLAERKALQQAVAMSCKGDVAALCGTVEKGKPQRECLKEKQVQASPRCQQALAALPQRHGKGRQ